jgi:hypothetical protein
MPFTACPPNIHAESLMDMGFVFPRTLARFRLPQIRFLYVRSQLCTALPSDPASRLTPLRFANTSPPSGCVKDFHLLGIEHARHTWSAGLRPASSYSQV